MAHEQKGRNTSEDAKVAVTNPAAMIHFGRIATIILYNAEQMTATNRPPQTYGMR
jgi:hypothetical protein